MKSGLAALVHPYSISDFAASYEAHQPFVIQKGEDNNIRELFELPFLASLDALLNAWPMPIQAHLPDVRDEVSSIDTTAKDARKLFDNGMGLLFNEAQLISPVLTEWLSEIRTNLGLSGLTYGRCLIYATPDGKGTAPHFDQNINFVLQIHGTKKWTMAPNESVVNPMTRFTMGTMVEPEMMSYQQAEMPISMPADSVTFELKPGSLLYVPRGCWHSTEAEGDALALNFTFTAPAWADLFLAALRGRLILSPEWRATADGVCDPSQRETAARKFDALLSTLVEDLPHWQGREILEAIEG